MFKKNHYINIFALLLSGIANTILLNSVLDPDSLLLPAAFFIVYVAAVYFAGNKLFPENSHLLITAMLILSPVTYYLLLVEYGFLVNAVLVLMVITFISRYTESGKMDIRFFISALIIGVTLYVNFSLLMFYILFTLFFFRKSIPGILIFSAAVLAVFLSIHYTGLFYNEGTGAGGLNSILLMLPLYIQIIFLAVTLFAGWIVADMQEVFFTGGLLTFIPSVVILMFKPEGDYTNAYSTLLALSYLSFSNILMALSVKPYKTDRYLGKVYSLTGN
jgi:hypothetical protein